MSASRTTAIHVYRGVLRQLREIKKFSKDDELTVRLPVDVEGWGHGATWGSTEAYCHSVRRYLGDLAQSPEPALMIGDCKAEGMSIQQSRLIETIRERFRATGNQPREQQFEALDKAFRVLRLLAEQTHLQECTSVATTEGVQVEITSAFVGIAKVQRLNRYQWSFTYRARISNLGSQRVKLLGRGWSIYNEHGMLHTKVPKGSHGVVGCTPILKPGNCFSYQSGAVVNTKLGSMSGSFQMVELEDGNDNVPKRQFDALVAPFKLIGEDPPAAGSESDDDQEPEAGWIVGF